MAGQNFLEQVHTSISHLKHFLDTTKVELGETAKKVIGIIGIALTCFLILASVVEDIAEHHPFKWRHFEAEIILLCVCWYLRYAVNNINAEQELGYRSLYSQ